MAGEGEKSLEQTPTWAVATVCTVFVVCSLLVERGIFKLGQYLKRSKQKELYHTLGVIRNELMLLGFVSLFLTVFQPKIASICMPERLNHQMLPCAYEPPSPPPPAGAPPPAAAAGGARRRRRLFAESTNSKPVCPPGKIQVVSTSGLHELHIFIFVLAVVHVLYSCVTVFLGLWQVHSWKLWEDEAREENHRSVDVALGKKTHKHASSNFVRKRASYSFLNETRSWWNLDSYLYCFFRQFGRPIYKHDYLCLRLGFIAEHKLSPAFDFHSYIRRTMEDDFKVVVGISWYLWAFVCFFLLLDIYGWYTYFWIAFIPALTVLFVGMKLQQIITILALEVMGGVEDSTASQGRRKGAKTQRVVAAKMLDEDLKADQMHAIKPRDDLFWFNRPRLLLYLVHFMLFQNAFEFAFFFWGLFSYGFNSCLVGKRWMIIVRLFMGVLVQTLCSASTLPLYALVSQLGSQIRMNAVLSDVAVNAIHEWRDKARKRTHKRRELQEEEEESSDDSQDAQSNHTTDIDIELQPAPPPPQSLNGQHAHANDHQSRNNAESNGFHHSGGDGVAPNGPTDSHSVEIQEQGFEE